MSLKIIKTFSSNKTGFVAQPEQVDVPVEESFREKQNWIKFKNNNSIAFREIYLKYYPALFKYGIRLANDEEITRDCIQDLFVELWKYRENLTTPDSIKRYLLLSIRRKIVKATSRKKRYLFGMNQVERYSFDFVHSVEETTVDHEVTVERSKKLTKAMNQLSPKQKEAIYLKYYENLSSTEIAEVMSLTKNSTYVIISESLKLLRKYARGSFQILILSFCITSLF